MILFDFETLTNYFNCKMVEYFFVEYNSVKSV